MDFKASFDGVVGWDEKKLNNEEYCRSWKLAGGSADILKDYGTRQGKCTERTRLVLL